MVQYLQLFYLNHRSELMDGYGKLVAHILKYRPGPFRGMPPFRYEVFDLPDEDIRLTQTGADSYALHALLLPMTISAEAKRSKWLLESFGVNLSGTLEGIDSEGTRTQLADLCLLRLRGEQSNEQRSCQIRKVLQRVTGVESKGSYQELLLQRLEQGSFKDESQWLASCFQSTSPELALTALAAAKANHNEAIRTAACAVITNRQARADVRAAAIDLASETKNQQTLLALCEVLDDANPAFEPAFIPVLQDDYPFADRLEVKTVKPLLMKQMQRSTNASKTIGDLAYAQLKKFSIKDFGKDVARWRHWATPTAK